LGRWSRRRVWDRRLCREYAGAPYLEVAAKARAHLEGPQLDAAQFAIDRFLNAKQNVSEQMAEIYQSIQDGSATDEDRKRLKSLREQYIALSKEVEDVMGRLLVGKQLPHPKLV
jgi:isocitrate dehydrogenase kinase/phosphatase